MLFADALKLFLNINHVNNYYKLQDELNVLQGWCKNIRLYMNINKRKVVFYAQMAINVPYSIDSIFLRRFNTIRDLVVTFDVRLSFDSHIGKVV